MVPQLHPEVSTVETEDGTVLLDERTGKYYQLNATGSWVLEAMCRQLPVDQIAERLADRYDIELEVALSDVENIMRQIVKSGLAST